MRQGEQKQYGEETGEDEEGSLAAEPRRHLRFMQTTLHCLSKFDYIYYFQMSHIDFESQSHFSNVGDSHYIWRNLMRHASTG